MASSDAPFDTGVMQTEKRPGPDVATHYSEESAAVEKCRNDVQTVTCNPHSQVNVTRTMGHRRSGHSTCTLARHSWGSEKKLFLLGVTCAIAPGTWRSTAL